MDIALIVQFPIKLFDKPNSDSTTTAKMPAMLLLWQTLSPVNHLSIALLSFLLLFLQYCLLRDPLRSIPGPLTARVSRLWMGWHAWKGDMNRTMIALHDKHGKLVRTGPNEISVSNLSTIKKIYGSGTKFVKSDWVKGP